MTRTDILNLIAAKTKAHSYLEIGVCDPDLNFNHINVPVKLGVDPDPGAKADLVMSSDEFFAANQMVRWSLIFIDGLHHDRQVMRDVINALDVLEEGGTIVLHDCNPTSETMQRVPREALEWTGDVWKAFVRLRSSYSDLFTFTVDTDYGCGVIRRGSQEPFIARLTWEEFVANRKKWLNLISVQEFLDNIDELLCV